MTSYSPSYFSVQNCAFYRPLFCAYYCSYYSSSYPSLLSTTYLSSELQASSVIISLLTCRLWSHALSLNDSCRSFYHSFKNLSTHHSYFAGEQNLALIPYLEASIYFQLNNLHLYLSLQVILIFQCIIVP